MIVKSGAIVTYAGQWPNPNTVIGQLFHPLSLTVSQISAGLGGDGLGVLRADYDAGIISSYFAITLKLVNNRGDFGSEADIISLVRHEVYAVTGAFPLSDSIPLVENPRFAPAITGQPSGVPSTSGSPSIWGEIFGGVSAATPPGLVAQTAGGLSDVLSELAGNTKLVVLGLGLGLLTAVLLIARKG